MSSSVILWEQLSRSRYRALAVKAMEECELAYQKWQSGGSLNGYQTTDNFEIDFQNWNLKRKGSKNKNDAKIRRCFQNGVWVQHRQSIHQQQVHFKLNNLRIDNQVRYLLLNFFY